MQNSARAATSAAKTPRNTGPGAPLPTGRPSDEERLNYGFLNVLDLPYLELVDAARETHRRIYEVKSGKVRSFRQKPEAQ